MIDKASIGNSSLGENCPPTAPSYPSHPSRFLLCLILFYSSCAFVCAPVISAVNVPFSPFQTPILACFIFFFLMRCSPISILYPLVAVILALDFYCTFLIIVTDLDYIPLLILLYPPFPLLFTLLSLFFFLHSPGIIHAVYELYGAELAGRLLSAFGRLFTYFLQGNIYHPTSISSFNPILHLISFFLSSLSPSPIPDIISFHLSSSFLPPFY